MQDKPGNKHLATLQAFLCHVEDEITKEQSRGDAKDYLRLLQLIQSRLDITSQILEELMSCSTNFATSSN